MNERELYQRAVDGAQETQELLFIAEEVINNLGDKEWSKIIYQQALEKAYHLEDSVWAVESILDRLDDKEWAKEIYKKAIEGLDLFGTLFVTRSMINNLGDKDLLRVFYKQAVDCAEGEGDFRKVAELIRNDLNDEVWANEILATHC